MVIEMKKLLLFTALLTSAFTVNALDVYEAESIFLNSGVKSDSYSLVKPMVDFKSCSIYFDGVKDDTAEVIHCEKGMQFSLMWKGSEGMTVATYVKSYNYAYVSQTRIGFSTFIQNDQISIGSIAIFPAK